MITAHGLSLMDLVSTELLRGLLAPFGHGLWTAILGGVLFSRSTRAHFLLTGRQHGCGPRRGETGSKRIDNGGLDFFRRNSR
jgi:hypothetical protein